MICCNLAYSMHFNSFLIFGRSLIIILKRPLTDLYKVELRKYKEIKKKY